MSKALLLQQIERRLGILLQGDESNASRVMENRDLVERILGSFSNIHEMRRLLSKVRSLNKVSRDVVEEKYGNLFKMYSWLNETATLRTSKTGNKFSIVPSPMIIGAMSWLLKCPSQGISNAFINLGMDGAMVITTQQFQSEEVAYRYVNVRGENSALRMVEDLKTTIDGIKVDDGGMEGAIQFIVDETQPQPPANPSSDIFSEFLRTYVHPNASADWEAYEDERNCWQFEFFLFDGPDHVRKIYKANGFLKVHDAKAYIWCRTVRNRIFSNTEVDVFYHEKRAEWTNYMIKNDISSTNELRRIIETTDWSDIKDSLIVYPSGRENGIASWINHLVGP